jgi:ribonuclease HI
MSIETMAPAPAPVRPVPGPPSVRPFVLTGTSRTGTTVSVDRRSNLCLWAVHVTSPEGAVKSVSGPRPGQQANPNDAQLAGMIRAALGECGWDGEPIQPCSTRTRLVLETIGITVDPWTAHGDVTRTLNASLREREAGWLGELVLTTDASLRHRGEVSGTGWVLDYGAAADTGEVPDPLAGLHVETASRQYGISWAEVQAIGRGIRAAVTKHPQLAEGVGSLTVRTDSQVAIHKVKAHLRGEEQGRSWDELCAQVVAPLGRAKVSFQWVRGHNGDPANEAADRLAMMARRNHEFGTDAETGQRMRLEAIEEVRAQLRAARADQA